MPVRHTVIKLCQSKISRAIIMLLYLLYSQNVEVDKKRPSWVTQPASGRQHLVLTETLNMVKIAN